MAEAPSHDNRLGKKMQRSPQQVCGMGRTCMPLLGEDARPERGPCVVLLHFAFNGEVARACSDVEVLPLYR